MQTPLSEPFDPAPSDTLRQKLLIAELNFLVVEDDRLVRLAARKFLRAMTAGSIFEAGNGNEALEILRNQETHRIDVILCDLNMPEMDGMEFLRNLAALSPGTPVIIISSHDDALGEAVRKMALAYGITLLGSIHKPVSPANLEALLLQYKPAAPRKAAPGAAAPMFTLEEIQYGIREKQFEPFYQPKVDVGTGAVTGAEALARWMHPRHGVVSPYAFIELLEKGGNIGELTFLILGKAAAACRLLRERGHEMTVSVNLSQHLLSDPLLANQVTQVVRDAGVDPKYIVLEITESAAMTHVAPALENLARLRMHGFGLSIDDFGTGFSNMQQIASIDFGELKIDQSFVKGCTTDKKLCAVVAACIDMAHQLKIKCIAEGVETRQDWDTLKDMGCDMVQGYLIARPMSLSAFLEFCSARAAQEKNGQGTSKFF